MEADVVVFQTRPGRAGLLDEPFWQNCIHLLHEELSPTLQVATEDVTPGRSTHPATSKRTCVDGDIRQIH